MALRTAGDGIEEQVISFCHGVGSSPCGHENMIKARKGLAALSVLWKIKTK
jgi:hypothetical protein